MLVRPIASTPQGRVALVRPIALHRPQAGPETINRDGAELVGVTLCGSMPAIEAWLATDRRAKRMPPPHPWHRRPWPVPPARLPARYLPRHLLRRLHPRPLLLC